MVTEAKYQEDIASYFNVEPKLLPFIPELLADLWALGSNPELIVEWLRPLKLPSASTKVLDLGCGKGAVSINLAKEFGFQIIGVDFFEPFLLEAEKKAEELGVSHLCRFEMEDINNSVMRSRDFDIAILASVGQFLGSWSQCIGGLRQTILQNRYMIIDDGFQKSTSKIDFPGYEDYFSHEDTLRQLISYGDKLIHEMVYSLEHVKSENQRHTDFISNRARALSKKYPKLAQSFDRFVMQEKQECKILETQFACATWMLQKVS